QAALKERQREYNRVRQREDAAWPLLTLLTRLAQCGKEPFDRAGELVGAFFGVCEVMREQELLPELDSLDAKRLAGHYGERWPHLAADACDAAIKTLKEGIINGRSRSLERQLTETVENPVLRPMWSMLYVVVEGLLTTQGRVFRKSEAQNAPTEKDNTNRRPCNQGDHLWLEWHEKQGLGPAKIRDRWNREYRELGGSPSLQASRGTMWSRRGSRRHGKSKGEISSQEVSPYPLLSLFY